MSGQHALFEEQPTGPGLGLTIIRSAVDVAAADAVNAVPSTFAVNKTVLLEPADAVTAVLASFTLPINEDWIDDKVSPFATVCVKVVKPTVIAY